MTIPAMPPAEAAHLEATYRQARIILEYGSGNSTRLASQLPGKFVMSVESDLGWARNLRREIDDAQPKSPTIIHRVDIGPTAAWGRPVDESGWRHYHRYPNAIWDQPYFRHPDVVLVDGRFRPACLIATIMHATRPVTVLFDDYADRPRYQLIERILAPVRLVGRMAEFHVQPGNLCRNDIGFAIGLFFDVTVHGHGATAYQLPVEEVAPQPGGQQRPTGPDNKHPSVG